jgi:hypothetical protein
MTSRRVLAGGEESLAAKVLFDPFEEQLDLPAALVERVEKVLTANNLN